MSVPFSNTNLRVPRGFGNILEGLAREVLRDQPKDIPTFAALYFNALLKDREESGLDPAEWSARLEDRFYNNHSFKDASKQGSSSAKEQGTAKTLNEEEDESADSREKSETIQSVQISTPSTEQREVSEDIQGVGLLGRDETDKDTREAQAEAPEVSNVDLRAEESRRTENEKPSESEEVPGDGEEVHEDAESLISVAELQPAPELTPEVLFGGLADVDVCAEELKDTLEEKETTSDKATENNESFIDANLTAAVESPRPSLAERERSESQDEVKICDGLTLPGVESPGQIQHDVEMELGGIADEDNIVDPKAYPTCAEETQEIDVPIDDSQYTTEMAEALDEDAESGDENIEQPDIKESFESVGVTTGKTNLDEEGRIEAESVTEVHSGREDALPGKEGEAQYQFVSDPGETILDRDDTQDCNEPEFVVQTTREKMVSSEFENIHESQIVEDIHECHIDEKEVNKTGHGRNDDKVMEVRHEEMLSTEQLNPSETELKPEHTPDDEHDETEVMEQVEEDISSTEQQDTSEIDVKHEDKTDNDHSDDSDIEETNKDIVYSSQQEISKIERDQEDKPKDSDNDDDGMNEMDKDISNTHQQDTSEIEKEQEDNIGEGEMTEDILLGGTVSIHKSGEAAGEKESETEMAAEEQPAESQELIEAIESHVDPEEHQLQDRIDDSQDPLSDGGTEEVDDPEDKSENKEECSQPQEEEDIMDIPLDDPEANKAAAKIQAGFRGHMTRKKMVKDDKPEEEVSSSGEALNGNQGDTGGSEGVDTDDTAVPEQ